MSALASSSSSPLVGEGRVGGREVILSNDGCKKSFALAPYLPTPTPNPSPTSMHSGARKRGPGGGGES
jgi:hypothetical protein